MHSLVWHCNVKNYQILKHLDIITSKVCSSDKLKRQTYIWQFLKNKVVFTNGCFDILHRGHLEYLAAAADLGNKLIVGLNEDASVTRLKGEGRPVNSFNDRALALASLSFVDAVCGFEEDTPLRLIEELSPNVLVKGGDYSIENIVGADFVKCMGGTVATIDFTEGYSTTHFLDRIKRNS